MDSIPNTPMDMSQILRIARSPAGKKLIELMQQNKNNSLRKAMENASSGDYDQARALIERFLATPEANALMEQLKEE